MILIGFQIFTLIIASGFIGAWGMYQWCLVVGWIESKQRAKQRVVWDQEHRAKQARRANWIKKWSSKELDKVPFKLQHVERQVLVSYGDLLKVWDISDHLLEDL